MLAAGVLVSLWAVWMAMRSTGGSNDPDSDAPPLDLSFVYRDLASRALLVPNWPDSTNTDKLLRRDPDGTYILPTFPEADAPLAVAALLDRNPTARDILRECDRVFAGFVGELRTVLADDPHLVEQLERNVWRIPEGTHHITVAVFQEHPSLLLEESDRRRWRPVPEPTAERIHAELSGYQSRHLAAPRLELDALLLTGDGVLIAGLVDPTLAFHKIRQSCRQIAGSILGDLTSRPKTLIHVTVGRVLALPEGTQSMQRRAVRGLVRRYNTQILPQKVTALQSQFPHRASFVLSDLTMIRDIVWTLRKIKEYGTWQLPLKTPT